MLTSWCVQDILKCTQPDEGGVLYPMNLRCFQAETFIPPDPAVDSDPPSELAAYCLQFGDDLMASVELPPVDATNMFYRGVILTE